MGEAIAGEELGRERGRLRSAVGETLNERMPVYLSRKFSGAAAQQNKIREEKKKKQTSYHLTTRTGTKKNTLKKQGLIFRVTTWIREQRGTRHRGREERAEGGTGQDRRVFCSQQMNSST